MEEKLVTREQWVRLQEVLSEICYDDGSKGVPVTVISDVLKTLTKWSKSRGMKMMLQLGEQGKKEGGVIARAISRNKDES